MYYCLKDHPEICVPDQKLEAGYIGGKLYGEKGVDWFFDRFKCADTQIKGDISVEYLYDRTTPNALKPFLPDPKFIVSLRDPVDRMVSSYFWLIRRGKIENLPLEKGIEIILDQKQGFPDLIEGPLEEVVRRSCYGPQIEGFIDVYGAERMFVLLYESIATADLDVIQNIYSFLGVSSSFVPPSLNTAPKKNSYNKALLAIENKFQSKIIAKLINYTNQAVVLIKPPKKVLDASLRLKLNELFAPTIEQTLDVLATIPEQQVPDSSMVRELWGRDA